jgi:hypothetical protein
MAKSAYYPDVSYVASGDARRPFVDTIQAEATLGQDGSLLAMAEPALRHAVVQGIVEGVASYMIRGGGGGGSWSRPSSGEAEFSSRVRPTSDEAEFPPEGETMLCRTRVPSGVV